MAPSDLILFPDPSELLPPVLPNRFQHAVAGLSASLRHHQRLVHQMTEHVQHLMLLEALPSAHRLGRLQGEAARKHREPSEQDLLLLTE